jgi:hypothetical protein
MIPHAVEALVAALLGGQWLDSRPADLTQAVRHIADSVVAKDASPSVAQARSACTVLNQQRHFEHTRAIAQAWHDRHGFDPTLQRLLSQSLINLGAADEAEHLVEDGLLRTRAPGAGAQAQAEIGEFEGLLGRIYKQRFVVTGDLDQLVKATNHYLSRYEDLPGNPWWHGINAVALRAREERAGVRVPGAASSAELAERVAKQARQAYKNNPDDPWAAATVSEALLALDDCDGAELWLHRFLDHPKSGPFQLDSYARQLQEIWQGRPVGGTTCADQLATLIARRLEKQQSRLTVSAAQMQALRDDPDGLEKNFSGEVGFPVAVVRALLKCCESVGCVTNVTGARLGTGFLLKGSSLKAEFGDGLVLVTNAHVIPDAVPADRACVCFELESEAAGRLASYTVGELLFTSPPDRLDATIVRIEGLPERATALEVAGQLPIIDAKARAYVIGHPQGGGLQVSLHDSLLLDVDDEERLLHYRTPTDPGSSGSPVFNTRWEVIALHHSGSAKTRKLHGDGTYEANEGIALGAIRKALHA